MYMRHFVKLTIGWKIRRGGPPPAHRCSSGKDISELSERICMNPHFFPSKKSSFNSPWYFFWVLAATNLSKISICSSSITEITLCCILSSGTMVSMKYWLSIDSKMKISKYIDVLIHWRWFWHFKIDFQYQISREISQMCLSFRWWFEYFGL